MKKRKIMNPWLIALIVVAVLAVATAAFLLLAPKPPEVGDRAKLDVVFTVEEQQRLDTVPITPAQLAEATCDDGRNCWIAVDGVVYDISVFPAWARGAHHGVRAGTDATEKFVNSGHAKAYLEKMPVVGRYTT